MIHAAVTLLWVAALTRMWTTFVGGPRPIWRVSFTLSVMFLALTATVRYEPALIDAISPNLAEVVAYVFLLMSIGAVNTYVDALTQESLRWSRLVRNLAIAALFACVVVVTWVVTPGIHDRQIDPSIAVLPMTPKIAVFIILTYVPVAATLWRVAVYTYRRHHQDVVHAPGESSGLMIIGAAAGLATVNFLASVVEVLVRLPGRPMPPDSVMLTLPRAVNVLALVGIAVGTTVMVAGPALEGRRQNERLARDITPLWRHLVGRHPQVRLPGASSTARKIIEIHDALALEALPNRPPGEASERGSPVWTAEEVVRVLVSGEAVGGTRMTVARALNEWPGNDDPVPALAAEFNRQRGERAGARAPGSP